MVFDHRMDGLHNPLRPFGIVCSVLENHEQILGCINAGNVDAAVHRSLFVLLGDVGDLHKAEQLLLLAVFVTPHRDRGAFHPEIVRAVGLDDLVGIGKVFSPAVEQFRVKMIDKGDGTCFHGKQV